MKKLGNSITKATSQPVRSFSLMSNCCKIPLGSGHVTFKKDWHCEAKKIKLKIKLIELTKIKLPKVEFTSLVVTSGQSFSRLQIFIHRNSVI